MLSAGAVAVGSETKFSWPAEVAANPSVASDAAGDYVVVWSATLSGGTSEINGQRFSSAGQAEGSEFTISGPTTYALSSPSVAMDEHGDFVVAWTSTNSYDTAGPPGGSYTAETLLAQRFDATGTAQGSVITVDTEQSYYINIVGARGTNSDASVQVAMDSKGDFVVAWALSSYAYPGQNYPTDTHSIIAQRYDASGTAQGTKIHVATVTGTHVYGNPVGAVYTSTVAMDTQGDFVVVWQSTNDDNNASAPSSINALRFDSSGNIKGSVIDVVDGETLGPQVSPTVAMDSTGDFAIAWPNGGSIDAQNFNAAGTAQAARFIVANGSTSAALSNPRLSMDSFGGFVVAWQTSAGSVDAQTYDATGKAQGSAIDIGATTASNPAVVLDSEGTFELVWQSSNGIYGQRYSVLPAITSPSTAAVNENSSLTFSTAHGNAVILSDIADSGISDSLSILAANGTMTLATTSGLTFTSGTNSSAAMTVQGTLAAFNSALAGLKFTPTANYAGAASLTLNFSDPVGGSGAQTINKVIPITVYPVRTIVDEATGYAETTGTWSTSSVTGYSNVATRNSSSSNAAATWTPVLTAGTYQVSFYNPATTGATTDAKITVVHNGTSNVYTVNEASGTPGFVSLGFLNFTGNGNEYVSISQGAATGTLYASAVQFAHAGSIPVLTAPTMTQITSLNTPVTFSTANSNALSMSDSGINTNIVQLSLGAVNGVLTLATISGLSFMSGANASPALTVQGTLAAINAALAGLKFTPTANYAGAASLSLNYSDLGVGGIGPAQTLSKTIPVTVKFPTYTIVDQSAGYAETAGTWATSSVHGYSGVATRSSSSSNAMATWTPLLTAGTYQVLFYSPATSGATTDAKITVVHNGTSNVYTVNEASGTAGYISLGFLNFTGGGNEHVSISQGATVGTLYASAVQLARSGSIPLLTAPATTQPTPVNTALTFSTATSNAISIADGSVNSNIVQLTLNAVHGEVMLATTSGLTFTSGANATGMLTVQGTLLAINAALNGLKFTPGTNVSGAASLTLNYSDLGVGGAGPAQTLSDTLAINVVKPNHAPMGTSGTVAGFENTAYTFKVSDFGFTDPNDTPPNKLLAVKITLLPTVGTLTDGGVTLTTNQFISISDISAGKLVFKPKANLSGGPFFLCKFQVEDDGGTFGGGVNLDPSAKVLDIKLTP